MYSTINKMISQENHSNTDDKYSNNVLWLLAAGSQSLSDNPSAAKADVLAAHGWAVVVQSIAASASKIAGLSSTSGRGPTHADGLGFRVQGLGFRV